MTIEQVHLLDAVGHEVALLIVRIGREQRHLATPFLLGEYTFGYLFFILANEAVGSIDNVLCRAVVLLQLVDAKVGVFVAQVEDVTFDEAEVKNEIEIAVEGFARQIEQRGMTLEGYLQACGRTREEMDEELRPQAEDTIKARMALNEIARLEGLCVTDEELQAAYEEVARMYGVTAQQVKDAYGEDNDTKLRKDVLLKKAIAVLEANAEITEE